MKHRGHGLLNAFEVLPPPFFRFYLEVVEQFLDLKNTFGGTVLALAVFAIMNEIGHFDDVAFQVGQISTRCLTRFGSKVRKCSR